MPEPQWDVAVVGSANLDVTLHVRSLPGPGETVLATGSDLGPGGKGANQAVAAARAGARTTFVGAFGDDPAAGRLRAALSAAGVDLSGARELPGASGTAYVLVDEHGENAIVVDPGANARLDLDDAALARLAGTRVLLAQLEVPAGVVVAAARAARGALVVLNAAPAQALPDALTEATDVLVVNEREASAVADGGDVLDALLARVPEVVVTLGAEGAMVGRRGTAPVRVPAVPARSVVDTTGAGDAFCGAYAAARSRGLDGLAATREACAAASLSVELAGAASAPTREQVQARLRG